MVSRLLCIASLLVLVAGCGPTGPKTYKVTGTITLDGSPVETATITFIPDDMENGNFAIGQSGPDGNYFLTTTQSGDGAVAGSYKIQVTKYQAVDGGPSPYGDTPAAVDASASQEDQDAAYQQAYSAGAAEREKEMAAGARAKPPKNELPAKYASIGSSGLTATVTPDGENTFNLELVSKK